MVSGVTRDRECARCLVPELALTITFDDGAEGHAHVLRATIVVEDHAVLGFAPAKRNEPTSRE